MFFRKNGKGTFIDSCMLFGVIYHLFSWFSTDNWSFYTNKGFMDSLFRVQTHFSKEVKNSTRFRLTQVLRYWMLTKVLFPFSDKQPSSDQRRCQWWCARVGCNQRWMSATLAWPCEVCDRRHLYSWALAKCELRKRALYLGSSAWRVFTSTEAGKGEWGSFLKITLELKLKEDQVSQW